MAAAKWLKDAKEWFCACMSIKISRINMFTPLDLFLFTFILMLMLLFCLSDFPPHSSVDWLDLQSKTFQPRLSCPHFISCELPTAFFNVLLFKLFFLKVQCTLCYWWGFGAKLKSFWIHCLHQKANIILAQSTLLMLIEWQWDSFSLPPSLSLPLSLLPHAKY